MSYLKKRSNALRFAFDGLISSFKKESHMKIHSVCAFIVIATGFYFKISPFEWIAILFCIALVITLELINTAIEKLCDIAMPDQHPTIKYIKDISAAAVLVVSVFAVITGILVFKHYLFP